MRDLFSYLFIMMLTVIQAIPNERHVRKTSKNRNPTVAQRKRPFHPEIPLGKPERMAGIEVEQEKG